MVLASFFCCYPKLRFDGLLAVNFLAGCTESAVGVAMESAAGVAVQVLVEFLFAGPSSGLPAAVSDHARLLRGRPLLTHNTPQLLLRGAPTSILWVSGRGGDPPGRWRTLWELIPSTS